jgi:hypothetical protein
MEISGQIGNPANGLKEKYQELMAIKDAPTLYAEALKLVTAYHQHGLSTRNFMKFQSNIRHIRDDVGRMQGLISNFILKADGFGVIYTG